MVKPCHYLNVLLYAYFIMSCHDEQYLLCSKGKIFVTNKISCCGSLKVEQKEATAELYILDANASCLPP